MSRVKQPHQYARWKHTARPKVKSERRHTDAQHVAFIRSLPCLKCGGQSECHHLQRIPDNSRGGALKAGDLWSTPLCHQDHMRLHEIGEWTFFNDIGITYPPALASLLYVLSGNETACVRAILEVMGR